MKESNDIGNLVDHLFRHESGKMIAVLTRLLGIDHLETAQDIVQDTLLQAMNTWSYGRLPDQPAAWLYRVARNKAIDTLRREKCLKQLLPVYAYQSSIEHVFQPYFGEKEIRDSQLRMMFACCHPSITSESQIALTLKTLCGLSVSEIAKAFLCSEDTINKRLYRAKERIRLERIGLEVPGDAELAARTDSVLKSLYLLFNEGYNSSQPDQLIREDLCLEAMRLCELLCTHPVTAVPRSKALMALFCFQASRLDARLDDQSHIVLLRDQDRGKWHRGLIRQGFEWLERAAEPFEVSAYHLEAAIASQHAAAPTFSQTDWQSIYDLYALLYQIQPNPIIAMNKAIASAYAIGKREALETLQQINGLENHHIYYASIGELYLELRENEKAKVCFEKAIALTVSRSERQLLLEKIARC